jgi:hypothetical protein
MTRPPDGREPRTVIVTVRLTKTGARYLDAARGSRTRSEYLRDLIAADCARRGVAPPTAR